MEWPRFGLPLIVTWWLISLFINCAIFSSISSPHDYDPRSQWSRSPLSWWSSSQLPQPLQEPEFLPSPSLPLEPRSVCYDKVPSPVCMVRMVYPAPLNHQKEAIGSSFQSLQGSSGHLRQTWLLRAPFDLVVHVGHREETKNLDWGWKLWWLIVTMIKISKSMCRGTWT